MRNFNIDFNELSTAKQDDIRTSMWSDAEIDLSAKGIKVNALKVAKIVDKLLDETFVCIAKVSSDIDLATGEEKE